MADPYFTKLPNIIYSNTIVKDITRRAKIVEGDAGKSPYVFYPYELNNEHRADHIADYYYGDPYKDWFIYMSNDIIDPFYGWYLSEDQFNELMIEKYGSVENSKKKIKYYRNNWYNDDEELTVSFYNNTLANSDMKYYSAVWSPNTDKIVKYVRKKDDHTMNTNKILEYTITTNNYIHSFISGEIVDLKNTGQEATVATGELVTANSTKIRIQSVSGNTTANSSLVLDIVGEDSFANMSVNAVSTVQENISNGEAVYWSPVYYYEWEQELNEQKKNILLVSDEDADIVIEQFERKINEDVDPETGLSNQ